jgi:hypothetical protein
LFRKKRMVTLLNVIQQCYVSDNMDQQNSSTLPCYRPAGAGASSRYTVGRYTVTLKSFETFALPVFATQVCFIL